MDDLSDIVLISVLKRLDGSLKNSKMFFFSSLGLILLKTVIKH